MRDSSRTPIRTRRRIKAFPSKRRRGSRSAKLTPSRIRERIGNVTFESEELTSSTTDFGKSKLYTPGVSQNIVLDSMNYQISRLLRRPYSPASFNSASKRAASKGLDTFSVSNHSLKREFGWTYRRGTA